MIDVTYKPKQYAATGVMLPSPGPAIFGYVILTGGGAAATADIREGGATGAIVLSLAAAGGGWSGVEVPISIYDPHLTIAGAGATLNVGM